MRARQKWSRVSKSVHLSIFITTHLLHFFVIPTFFQALETKTSYINQKQISGLTLHLHGRKKVMVDFFMKPFEARPQDKSTTHIKTD